MSLKSEVSLNPRHKKRRPRTSFFVDLVGRGNLNRSIKLLILIDKYRLSIFLEYLLEYPSMNLNSGRFGLRKLIVSRGKACALSHSV